MDNLNIYQGGGKSTFSINALTYMFKKSYAADIASKGVSPAEISYFIDFHNINFGAINSAPLWPTWLDDYRNLPSGYGIVPDFGHLPFSTSKATIYLHKRGPTVEQKYMKFIPEVFGTDFLSNQ